MDLEGILSSVGIPPIKVTTKEVWALCPNPKHNDHKPSWSINRFTYRHNCFSCGFKGGLTELLEERLGGVPEDLEKTLNVEGFLRKMQEARAKPAETLAPVLPTLTEWALANVMVDVPERLLAFRQLQRAAIDRYEVRWDRDTKQWVLPLRSAEGALLGAQYRQKGSVLTLPEGMAKSKTFFGLPQCYDKSYCTLVESPLDAVRLAGLGIPALSSLGAWVSKEQVTLLARNFNRVYLALDNDKTGRESAAVIAPLLRRAGTVSFPWDYSGMLDEEGSPAKDPGDVVDDEMLLHSWTKTQRMGF
jgi:hypothetical protein